MKSNYSNKKITKAKEKTKGRDIYISLVKQAVNGVGEFEQGQEIADPKIIERIKGYPKFIKKIGGVK